MQRPGQPSAIKTTFYSQKNRTTLQQIVTQDIERRQGITLNERQKDRLERTIDHYVEEVYGSQGNQPLPLLNKEVIKVTAADFSKYLQRQTVVASAPVTATQTVMTPSQAATIFQDTSQRYETIQNERNEGRVQPPTMPDFRIALDDDGPSPADLYEAAKKARESEAIRLASLSKDAMERMDPGIQARMIADDSFRQGQQSQNRATDLVLSDRRLAAANPVIVPLVVPPDGRELALLALNPGPRAQGDANASSVTTIPPLISAQKSNLPQDYLIRQNSVVEYKEIENNLFVCSADRDWLKNVTDNRYSFTVNFDVLQYDANWYSDPGTSPAQTDSRGYTAFIPKFLKCQKVYSPAPLSTLQRLSIDLLQPTGSILSLTADTLDISAVKVGVGFATAPYASGSSSVPEYFVIQTNTYFSRFQMAVGDTIRIGNFGYSNNAGGNGALQEFSTWLNQADGHVIAAIGYFSGAGSTMNAVIPNTVGYANCIIIQNRYTDPTTGSVTPYQFGGSTGNIGTSLSSPPSTTTVNSLKRLINLSRQTQLVFRVITREMDPGASLRPDNM